jgi:N4-gp56 family major capsid protein
MSQVWAVAEEGGYMYSDNLSDILRTALEPLCRFRNVCEVEDAVGKHRGQQFNWNTYSKIANKGRAIAETETMPQSKFRITQASLEITEYGNSVPFTKKLDDMSRHDVVRVIHKVLKNDATEVLDEAAHAQFDATVLTVSPTGGNSATAVTLEVGGATITNNIEMGKDHVKAIVDLMEERNIPPFEGNDYMCLARPTTLRPFKDDLEAISIYIQEGFNKVVRGEIGGYEGVRFVKQTNIASEGWTNAKSDGAFFFGEDGVVEGASVVEEIRGKIPTDFGRDKAIAWYYVGGFGIVHNTPAGDQNRIIKWASAA